MSGVTSKINEGSIKKKHGLFIVIEGTDRCGKSTQAKKLLDFIGKQDCEEICFPDRTTRIGKVINDILVNTTLEDEPMNHQALHLLFSSNRWENNDIIKKILLDSRDIVCSRYFYSGAAYSMAKGLDYDWCLNPEKGLICPDIVFYLKMKDSRELSKRDGFGDELYEQEDFQQKVSESFDIIFKKEMGKWKYGPIGPVIIEGKEKPISNEPMIVEIDASLPMDEIASKIIDAYKSMKQ